MLGAALPPVPDGATVPLPLPLAPPVSPASPLFTKVTAGLYATGYILSVIAEAVYVCVRVLYSMGPETVYDITRPVTTVLL